MLMRRHSISFRIELAMIFAMILVIYQGQAARCKTF